MTNCPSVTIIIPVFNGRHYLRQCLNSIVSQTFSDFEIICINDFSTDKSLTVLNEFLQKDSRFKILSLTKNYGQALARNRGLELANGEYVCFIDDDDFIENNYLEVMVNQIRSRRADICVCGGDEYWDLHKIYKQADWILNLQKIPENQPFNVMDVPRTIFQICGEAPWAKIYRRNFLFNHDFSFDDLPVFEDFPFACKCIVSAYKISCDSSVLYHHRKYPGNSSSTLWNFRVNFDALMITKDFLIRQELYEIVKHSYLDKCLYAIQWRLLQAANPEILDKTLKEVKNKVFPELNIEKELENLSPQSQIIVNSILADY